MSDEFANSQTKCAARALALVHEFSKQLATESTDVVIDTMTLLSALRGPDSSSDILKSEYSAPIRRVLFPDLCDYEPKDPETGETYNRAGMLVSDSLVKQPLGPFPRSGYHYFNHINSAVGVLRRAGVQIKDEK